MSKTFKQTVSFDQVTAPKPLPDNWPLEWGLATSSGADIWDCNKKEIRKVTEQHWRRRWEHDRRSRTAEISWEPDGKFLSLNRGLHKAQSSLATQLSTGKIGLNGFLYLRKVPDHPSPRCEECNVWESPRHVTVFCRRYSDRRWELREGGHLDFNELMTTRGGLNRLTKWWLRIERLGMYSVANDLISD